VGWGAALLLTPFLVTAVETLIERLDLDLTLVAVSAGVLSFTLGLPLQVSASAALFWRMLGSRAHGALRRGPIVSLFLGFRFYGPLFAVGLAVVGVAIILAVIPTILYVTLLLDSGGVPELSAAPGEWSVFATAVGVAVLTLMVLSARWAAAVPIAIAEDRKIGAAMSESASLVKGRFGTVLIFVLLASLVSYLPWIVSWSVSSAFGPASDGAAQTVLTWWDLCQPLLRLPFDILGAVFYTAAMVALYRLLRATADSVQPGVR
jgi:hypothetical protein